MKRIASIATVTGAVAAAVMLMGPAANAASTIVVHPGGFDHALSDTRSAGHVDFLENGGLGIWTDDATSNAKAAEYVDITPQNGLPSAVTLAWDGSSPAPGSQIVFDADQANGNGNDFNILVGEPGFYGNDFWLTNGSSALAHSVCPETGGGFGSACHGTLQEWQAALPNAQVGAYGFSLGSGIKGGGILHNITADGTTIQFAPTPAPAGPTTVNTVGTASITPAVKAHRIIERVKLSTNALGPNEVQGTSVHWKVTVDGKAVSTSTMGAGQKSNMPLSFAKGTGKHVVQVLNGSTVVASATARTGR